MKKIWNTPVINKLAVNLTKAKQIPSTFESGKGKNGTYVAS